MIQFERELLTEIIDEITPLTKAHHEEISRFKDIPLEPDQTTYLLAEKAGIIRLYTARKEKKLIGYALFVVRSHAHYQSILQATQQLLYIHFDHRGFGMRFLRWCDEELKKENVCIVQHSVSVQNDFSLILNRMGYELSEKLYVRRL